MTPPKRYYQIITLAYPDASGGAVASGGASTWTHVYADTAQEAAQRALDESAAHHRALDGRLMAAIRVNDSGNVVEMFLFRPTAPPKPALIAEPLSL